MTQEMFDRVIAEMIRDGELDVLLSDSGEVVMASPGAFTVNEQDPVVADFLTK